MRGPTGAELETLLSRIIQRILKLLTRTGLRLHQLGMIRASPQKIIAQGTDWRFLSELKKELKA